MSKNKRNNPPTISVISVTFNNLQELRKTADSLRKQNNKDFEWVVIDGGSTDGTLDFLKSETLIDKFISEPDSGIYNAMKKGFLESTGSYLWFLNSGDLAETEDSIQIIIDNMNDNSIFYFSAIFSFADKILTTRNPRTPEKSIKYSVPGNQQATIYKKNILYPKLFEHQFTLCGDYYMSAMILKNNPKCGISNKIISRFYMGGASTFKIWSLCKQAYIIQREILKLPPLVRIAYLIRRITTGGIAMAILAATNMMNKNEIK